jgi:quinol monooxygenase YgiN
MSRVALVVEFEIRPGMREAFLQHLQAHAEATLAEVEGCLQFDVLVPKELQFDAPHVDDPNHVFLYEVYADDAALISHVESPRVARTRAGYVDMVLSRRIVRCFLD